MKITDTQALAIAHDLMDSHTPDIDHAYLIADRATLTVSRGVVTPDSVDHYRPTHYVLPLRADTFDPTGDETADALNIARIRELIAAQDGAEPLT